VRLIKIVKYFIIKKNKSSIMPRTQQPFNEDRPT